MQKKPGLYFTTRTLFGRTTRRPYYVLPSGHELHGHAFWAYFTS